MKVLITGGAGFIGSTVASACLDHGITPVIVDDLSTGRSEFVSGRSFYYGDVADGALLDRIFGEHGDIEAVIHCAGKIIVPESMERPLDYYDANIGGLLSVVRAMERHGCHRIVFSSSASIYAPGPDFSVDENSVLRPSSPYGRTKYVSELILDDVAAASDLRALSLRYFNPIGADPQLRTGLANPKPTHALGKIIEAYEQNSAFTITGVDLPTRDGTGLRDYIHVWDLALAHLAALRRFDRLFAGVPALAVNIGTGAGTTVGELVAAFERVIGASLPVVRGDARPGDLPGCYARCGLAELVLGWGATMSVEDGIRDALAWSARRPHVLRNDRDKQAVPADTRSAGLVTEGRAW